MFEAPINIPETTTAWLELARSSRLEKNWLDAKNALSGARHLMPHDDAVTQEDAELQTAMIGAFNEACKQQNQQSMAFLLTLAPEYKTKMIHGISHDEFCRQIARGNLPLVICLMEHLPEYILEMLAVDHNKPIRCAMIHGQVPILQQLQKLVPRETVISSLKYLGYLAVREVVFKKHQTMLEHLFTLAPELVPQMIACSDFCLFRLAIMSWDHTLITFLLDKVTPEQLPNMIESEDFEAFSLAAMNGLVNVMKELVRLMPGRTQDMIKARQYAAYDKAKYHKQQDVLEYLSALVDPADLEYMRMRCWQTDEELQARIAGAETTYAHVEDQSFENAFLWLAEKEGCAPVYLFGTIHLQTEMLKNRFYGFVNRTLAQVETCFTEVDVLNRRGQEKSEDSLDEMIALRAVQMGKQQKTLEDDRLRLLIVGEDGLREASEEVMRIKSNPDLLQRTVQEFLNTATLSGTNDYHCSRRNKLWMALILTESAHQKPSLVAVGARHNEGRFGLPNLLAHEGYTVTAIEKPSRPSPLFFSHSAPYNARNICSPPLPLP